VPLRLFSSIASWQLQGKADSSEKELFFPDLDPAGALAPSPWTLAKNELAPFLQTQRARFQRGLLAWLRGQAAGLEDMRQGARRALPGVAQLPEPRALAWVAIGLIDGLLDAPGPEWQASAKGALQQDRFPHADLAAGSQAGQRSAAARNVLYSRRARQAVYAAPSRNIKLLYASTA